MEQEKLIQMIENNQWISIVTVLSQEIERLKGSGAGQGYSDLVVIDEGEE